MIQVGDIVQLFNLKSLFYNGKRGIVKRLAENGRWVVQVEGQEKSFKPENLKKMDYIVIPSEDEQEQEQEQEQDNDRRRKRPRVNEATTEAWVDPSHTPETPGHEFASSSSEATETETISRNVFSKIRKMLLLGLHPDTPQEEAQAAFRNANKYLIKYNITQEDIFKKNDGNERNAAMGGMVPVILRNIISKRPQNIPRWADKMASAVSKLFGVKNFFYRGSGKIIFYGLLVNSRLAAFAFSKGFHYIHVNMRRYIPSENDDLKTRTITARNCYADGVVEGIRNLSKKEKKEVTQEGGRALTLFNRQQEIAAEVLRSNGILNLRKGRSRRARVGFARDAFLQGKEDASSINFFQRSIKNN